MGSGSEVEGGILEEDGDTADLRSMTLTRGMGSIGSSLNNICWVNIKEGGGEEGRDVNMNTGKMARTPVPQGNKGLGCCGGLLSFLSWIWADFRMPHLIWIKLVFLFQSASMTVLYPFLNLHMKSLGISIQETAIINAVIPVLFIFTPPLAGFLADRIGNFRILLSLLTASGGLVSLLLLVIPTGRDISMYPDKLSWGLTCGPPGSRAQYQNLMLHGFSDNNCKVKPDSWANATFSPGVCGYMCPTRSRIRVTPRFFEYKVVWPNRGGGFGITEIVDVVNLEALDARLYHEPRVLDSSIFFPMNWTFQLNCDRIRSDDCIFNPVTNRRRGEEKETGREYDVTLSPMQLQMRKSTDHQHPEFVVESITTQGFRKPVSRTINCGSKSEIAQVVSTVETSVLGPTRSDIATNQVSQLVDTKLNDCSLTCLVQFQREQLCSNSQEAVSFDPSLTFWSYLLVRTVLGVLTAASLMMFEGAVMATIQELGGDYGLQRFVGNFGAIVFAPMGGWLIDTWDLPGTDFSPVIYIYLGLKLLAAFLILFVRLDFKQPGEKILSNVKQIVKNSEVVVFLVMMMFAGVFWGFIEAFLFWFLDDLGANKLDMGWTVTIGMLTSLPFLIFSGPITDTIGHINVIVLGMLAYFVRLLGYSFLQDPLYVYPYEALEGFTMALMMTSAVTYVAKISTPTTIASVMGLMGSLFFGIGKGSGSLFGGLLMSFVGTRWTFRLLAMTALTCALSYTVFQVVVVVPRRWRARQEEGRIAERHHQMEQDRRDEVQETEEKQDPAGLGPRSLNGGTRV